MKIFPLQLLSGLIILLFSVSVNAEMPTEDIPGSHDHPLLSRFKGSFITAYQEKSWDSLKLVSGATGVSQEPSDFGKIVFGSMLELEGKDTWIVYNYPQEKSALEVFRNYENALKKAGFTGSYQCLKDECGKSFGDLFYDRIDRMYQSSGINNFISPFNYGREEPFYILAKGNTSSGVGVAISLYIVPPRQGQNGGIALEIVEQKPMEDGQVSATLTATEILNQIKTNGKVALYGIYFDTDQSVIKPESQINLSVMAKALETDPTLRVFIVGHTDNTGSYPHNLELSQKRAQAVASALTNQFKIDSGRLLSAGIASLSPLGSNDTADGRAKNRRVEMVKQ